MNTPNMIQAIKSKSQNGMPVKIKPILKLHKTASETRSESNTKNAASAMAAFSVSSMRVLAVSWNLSTTFRMLERVLSNLSPSVWSTSKGSVRENASSAVVIFCSREVKDAVSSTIISSMVNGSSDAP